ncbi:MAG: hypothetical protein KKE44_15180 [Proteobacteria bacterium]|nr:hypothetical protein [Pseudomonadota bacterium]MBU1584071.1 hypothetical protein [Pseudomonadota bacterium]MBU2629908.1 hypothetical protein [Pseudomonadota bacterium]
MLEYDLSKFEKSCCQLFEVFKNQLTWKWDSRFETVLAEFSVKEKASVQKSIKTHMGTTWDDGNSGNAPETVKMIINCFGGMNPGQQLFTSDPEKDDIVLCAWWPWGNGQTISIRLGVFANTLNDDDNKELTRLFRGWFDL